MVSALGIWSVPVTAVIQMPNSLPRGRDQPWFTQQSELTFSGSPEIQDKASFPFPCYFSHNPGRSTRTGILHPPSYSRHIAAAQRTAVNK